MQLGFIVCVTDSGTNRTSYWECFSRTSCRKGGGGQMDDDLSGLICVSRIVAETPPCMRSC